MSLTFDNIGNYHGTLNVRDENGVFEWGIEGCSGVDWDRIPESLYNELVKFKGESDDMNDTDLCKWLRGNSSGVYQPSAEAADRIEQLKAEVVELKGLNQLGKAGAQAMRKEK
jgi:hypothetical protein